MNVKNQIFVVRGVIITVIIVLFIIGCNNSTEPQKPKERWKSVNAFGNTQMTGLYLNSNKTKLSVTTTEEFGLILSGEVEPTIVNALETSIDGTYLEYIPYFCDEHYFYCDRDGQIMYVGDNTNGEFVGTIPITSIVDSLNLPAKYTISGGMSTCNHIETNSNGLYMISIRQIDPITNNNQDDRLYFGSFDYLDNSLQFNIEQSLKSYKVPTTYQVDVRSNYYYGGYFWQYRDDSFHPSIVAVNEVDFNVQYLNFNSAIHNVFAYKSYTIGVFDRPLKKSFDGGFTWEDWLMLNAPWNFVEIAGKNVTFFSHNIASIDFETIEIKNYDIGELQGYSIIGMAEFDDKVFAATLGGLFYCEIEDFFILQSKGTRKSNNDLDLKITKKY